MTIRPYSEAERIVRHFFVTDPLYGPRWLGAVRHPARSTSRTSGTPHGNESDPHKRAFTKASGLDFHSLRPSCIAAPRPRNHGEETDVTDVGETERESRTGDWNAAVRIWPLLASQFTGPWPLHRVCA